MASQLPNLRSQRALGLGPGSMGTVHNSAFKRLGMRTSDIAQSLFSTQNNMLLGGKVARSEFFGFWGQLSILESNECASYFDTLLSQIRDFDNAVQSQVRLAKETIASSNAVPSREVTDKLIQLYSPQTYQISTTPLAAVYNTLAFMLCNPSIRFDISKLINTYNVFADPSRDPIRFVDSHAFKTIMKLLAIRSQADTTDEGVLSPFVSLVTHLTPSSMPFSQWAKLTTIDETDLQTNELGFVYGYIISVLSQRPAEILPPLLKALFDKAHTLPQQIKTYTLTAHQSFLALLLVLRNALSVAPQGLRPYNNDILLGGIHVLKSITLWHQPYGNLAEQMIRLLQHEVLNPGFSHKLAVFRESLSVDYSTGSSAPSSGSSVAAALQYYKASKPIFYLYDSLDSASLPLLNIIDAPSLTATSIVRLNEQPHTAATCASFYPPAPILAQIIINTLYSISPKTQLVKDECESLRVLKQEQLIHLIQKLTYLEEKYFYRLNGLDLDTLTNATATRAQQSHQAHSSGSARLDRDTSIIKSTSSSSEMNLLAPPELESPTNTLLPVSQPPLQPIAQAQAANIPYLVEDREKDFLKFKTELLEVTSMHKSQPPQFTIPYTAPSEQILADGGNPNAPVVSPLFPPLEHVRVSVDLKSKFLEHDSSRTTTGFPAAAMYDRLRSILETYTNAPPNKEFIPISTSSAKDMAVLERTIPFPAYANSHGLAIHQHNLQDPQVAASRGLYLSTPPLPLEPVIITPPLPTVAGVTQRVSMSMYIPKISTQYKKEIRFVIVGNDRMLQHAMTAYYLLQTSLPRAFQLLDIKFYIVPCTKNNFANYIACRDLWYLRHVYTPFRSPFSYVVPWLRDDEVEIKVNNEAGLVGLPTDFYRETVAQYVREAHHKYHAVIFKLEGKSAATEGSVSNSDATEVIPFLQRIEVGTNPAIEEFRVKNGATSQMLKAEDVLKDKAFVYTSVDLSVKYIKVDLMGKAKPEVVDEPIQYQSITLSHIPRKSTDSTVVASNADPHSTMLDLFVQPGAKIDKSRVKKNALVFNPRQNVSEITLTAASGSFKVLADGVLYGPYRSVRISVATVHGKVARFPIQTYFPLNQSQ